MSHITTLAVKITNIDALGKACAKIGAELVLNQTSFKWYYSEKKRCTHAIRVPGAQYEVGVVQDADGKSFSLQYDEYHSGGGLERVIGAKANALRQAYTTERARAELLKAGATNIREEKVDGKVRLVAVARR